MTDKPLTDVPFSNFDLHPDLLAGLEKAGFNRCTPIQALTLPVALPGGDVAGQAQTGTGKTLAFLVAVVNRLLTRPALAERKPEDPRALILAPTRELAIQIHKDAIKFCSDLGLKFALVYGGVDYDKQREILRAGADVIIATPGRLIDYVKQHKVVSLHACEACVLDEADRMFDLGFIKDLRFLLRRMPVRTERQTLLFSATLSHRVLELAYEHMNEPEKLVVEAETVTAARVRQRVYFPANEEKLPLLMSLLSRGDAGRTMVFVNTKAWVERVARALERGHYKVGVLSGDVPQKKRESLLARFQKGQLEILVATDVAARGLHIDGVSHVYNYDLPFDAEDYVHRIGRTARLGAEGDAISFACEMYAMSLPDIEAYIEQKIPVEAVTPDLLVPIPRKRPDAVEGEEVPEGESLQEIFAEAREVREHKRDLERGRSGGGRGRGGSAGPGAPRRGDRDRPRRERRPGEQRESAPVHAQGDAPAPASVPAAAAAEPVASAATSAQARVGAAAPDAAPSTDAEGAPRKRRRRRGGRGRSRGEGDGSVEGNGEATGSAPRQARPPRAEGERAPRGDRPPRGDKPQRERGPRPPRAEQPAAPAAPAGDTPGLIGRLAKGIKSLFGGKD